MKAFLVSNCLIEAELNGNNTYYSGITIQHDEDESIFSAIKRKLCVNFVQEEIPTAMNKIKSKMEIHELRIEDVPIKELTVSEIMRVWLDQKELMVRREDSEKRILHMDNYSEEFINKHVCKTMHNCATCSTTFNCKHTTCCLKVCGEVDMCSECLKRGDNCGGIYSKEYAEFLNKINNGKEE